MGMRVDSFVSPSSPPFEKGGRLISFFFAAFLIIKCSASGLKYMTLMIKIVEYTEMLVERFSPGA
jgi:hypothetical protein